jgi:hypothetical protein
MYGRADIPHKPLVHEFWPEPCEVIPEVPTDVEGLWIHSGHKREVSADGKIAGTNRRGPGHLGATAR